MNLINRAFSGFRRGVSNIRRFGTMSNANKLLGAFNGGLKTLGGRAVDASNWYSRATSNNVIPKTEIGDNVVKVISSLGKLS